MKARWQTKVLGDVCKTGSGGTPLKSKKEFYENGTIPWLMSGEVSQGEVHVATRFITKKGLENSSARIFPKNTVLIAMYGATAGQVGILKFEASTNQAVCGILPNEQFIPEFLYYLFLSKKDELISQATGNAQPNISQIKIKNTIIPIASLDEQQRIVAILDQAFEGIAKARTNAEQNLKNARALFESHLQSVFNQRGERWTKSELGNISKINYGYTESANYEKVGPNFLRITDIQDVGVNWDTVPYCIISDDDLPKYQLRTGDIVFARTGATTGKSYLVNDPPKAVFASYLIRVQLKLNELLPEFLFLFFQTKSYWDEVSKGLSGSAQGGFNASKLGNLIISYPTSIEEQKAIINELEEIKKETQLLETLYQRKIALLDELKKSLLQLAFAGEL